jgi:hypothetical protein
MGGDLARFRNQVHSAFLSHNHHPPLVFPSSLLCLIEISTAASDRSTHHRWARLQSRGSVAVLSQQQPLLPQSQPRLLPSPQPHPAPQPRPHPLFLPVPLRSHLLRHPQQPPHSPLPSPAPTTASARIHTHPMAPPSMGALGPWGVTADMASEASEAMA